MSPYSFAVFLLVIISVANAGKVCPGYGFIRPPEKCESTCSNEKDECVSSGKKCCFRIEQPCGFHCIIPKDNRPKAGKCPSSASMIDTPYWGICDAHFCDVDDDCKDAEKCCHNPCGAPICIAPQ